MLTLLALTGCLIIDDDLHDERLDELSDGPTTDTSSTGPEDTATPPTDTGTTDTDEPLDPPAITGLEPAFGTDAGGTTVTITGGPFAAGDPALSVLFGGNPATVLTVDADTLTVNTPSAAAPGDASVLVITGGGQATSPTPYEYWADATGEVGATGELAWYRYVGGEWGPQEGETYGRSTVRFVEGGDLQFYKYWAENLDTCTHWTMGVPDWEYTPEVDSYDALTGTLTQSSPYASIELEWNTAEVRFTNYDLSPSEVVPGETYDLILEGTTGLPEITMPGAFPLPADFEVTNPRIDSPTRPPIRADHQLAWNTDEEGDVILLQIGMLTNDGTQFQEELHCAVRDVGSFWLEPEWWNNWIPGRSVHVLIGRYNTGVGLLPWNNGRIEVAAQTWYYGLATAQ